MSETVLINVGAGETRVAVLENGRPTELVLERTMADATARTGRAGHSIIGNIFLGRVMRVLPGMQAAFVDVGLEKSGFLGAREARCLCELTGLEEGRVPPISSCVHEGQRILVQAVKDPINDKGARLSANVTLPGRLLVLVPNQSGVVLSRRIEDEDERARLTELVESMVERFEASGVTGEPAGFIIRTAAIGATESEIATDARALAEEWLKVRAVAADAEPPSLIFHDLDPVSQTLRDHVGLETERVVIDDADALAEARRYAQKAMPHALERLNFFNGPGDLFEHFNVEAEIETALSDRVPLASGGWITIETTEALTAIDVNSGSYTAATGLEETSIRINLEAAEEIVSQLRLRGTGGLIVIDFIHMEKPENIDAVTQALNNAFAKDRVPTQVSGMSEFGLVEMTRKRVREPLDKLLTEPLAPGRRDRQKTCATVANEILRRAMADGRSNPGKKLVARAAPEVVDWLVRGNPQLLERLEQKRPGQLTLIADPAFSREELDIAVLDAKDAARAAGAS